MDTFNSCSFPFSVCGSKMYVGAAASQIWRIFWDAVYSVNRCALNSSGTRRQAMEPGYHHTRYHQAYSVFWVGARRARLQTKRTRLPVKPSDWQWTPSFSRFTHNSSWNHYSLTVAVRADKLNNSLSKFVACEHCRVHASVDS